MAISRMVKILIAGHIEESSSFMETIQKSAIIHPEKIFKDNIESTVADSKKYKDILYTENESKIFQRLENIRAFLEDYREKDSFLQTLAKPLNIIKKDDFNKIVHSYSPVDILNRAEEIKNSILSLNNEKKAIIEENKSLLPWNDLTIDSSLLTTINDAEIFIGFVENKRLKSFEEIENVDIQIVKRLKNKSVVIAAAHNDNSSELRDLLKIIHFNEISFPDIDTSPSIAYSNNLDRITEIESELKLLEKKAVEQIAELNKIEVLLEHYSNLKKRSDIVNYWLSTENAFILSGWIKQSDLEKIQEIVSLQETVVFETVTSLDGESPPIALENSPLFTPFQLITRLYSYPSYKSIDPSSAASLFFVVFFGICLTDAGYGLILAILALLGIWKFKKNRDLLWIIFWGGIFTIIAGLLTGGIFGNLFRTDMPFVNTPVLSAIRDKITWFDPMVEPMVFFRLVLFLGVVHVATGLVIGIISNLKQKKFGDAVVDNLSWLTILISLLLLLFSSEMCVKMALVSGQIPPVSSVVAAPALTLVIIMSLIIVLFSARDEKSLFFRFFIGFLKLVILSGIFSYLGDILSYIRLMALGMVTAGIGMAINTIAFMMYDIPVVGIVFTILILVFGHLFNMAINLLGGFVHTLRLQYVEFFSKFFVGGGKEFIPLSYEEKYYKIIE